MSYAKINLGFKRIVAITNPDNHNSIKLLEKLGLKFEKQFVVPGDEEELMLFAITFDNEA